MKFFRRVEIRNDYPWVLINFDDVEAVEIFNNERVALWVKLGERRSYYLVQFEGEEAVLLDLRIPGSNWKKCQKEMLEHVKDL